LFEELQQLLAPDRVTRNQTILEQHSKDESWHEPCVPDVVVYPINTNEVSEIVKLADKYNTVIVPFGLGSSLEGRIIPYIKVITKDDSKILKLADKYYTAFVSFSFGSSLKFSIIPNHKCITIDFSYMNKILEVREEDFLVRVQPGVTRLQLNKELKKHGLFF